MMTEKEMMRYHCQSYIPGERICRDGFPISGACFGSRCHACRRWTADKRPPQCMNEDLAPYLIDEAGLPRLVKR